MLAAKATVTAAAAIVVVPGLCMRASVASVPAPPPPTVKPIRVAMLLGVAGSSDERMLLVLRVRPARPYR